MERFGTSFNTDDGVFSHINCKIEYKIIGDSNADTSTVNIVDVYYQEVHEQERFSTRHNIPLTNDYLNLMNYDHLEIKVTISSSTVKPTSLKLYCEAFTAFKNRKPDYSSVREELFTINNPDTTFYFTWSPADLN